MTVAVVSLDAVAARFADVSGVPLWALRDTSNRILSTVRARRHLIFFAATTCGFPIMAIADWFGMSRVTVWRAIKHHQSEVRGSLWAERCAAIDAEMTK